MFYHIFPCRSVFLLELTLSSGERVCVCVGKRERVYLLTLLVRGFLFFSFVDCIPVFSLSLSLPPPPPPPLFFFREGKTLLSSRLELLFSAYLAILLFSSSSLLIIIIIHHGYLGKDCVSHIYHLPFPCLALPQPSKEKKNVAEYSKPNPLSSRNESMKDDPQEIYNWRVFVLCASVSPSSLIPLPSLPPYHLPS